MWAADPLVETVFDELDDGSKLELQEVGEDTPHGLIPSPGNGGGTAIYGLIPFTQSELFSLVWYGIKQYMAV